ncbi:MAG TPA: RDD family protein [Candidatus Dormibacteraeota bacterium]|nr:RDD family protein [Candidatus Dormibacteraeota bacterium]
MQPPDASDDLIISTPERVAFQYEIAGIGSRFLAQIVDSLIITAILIAITILAASLGGIFSSGELALLVEIILGFILLAGYFLISEAAWNGQTIGKRAARLRVVGDHGEPLTVGQAAIRNLVRIVDFLPFFYAIGMLTLFINGRGKRLGDFAAGTLVVRDRERISLYDLSGTPAGAASAPATPSSIWAAPSVTPVAPMAEPQALDSGLRRLVVAYAARREELPIARREALAQSAEAALRRALPQVVATAGPLAALDQLAEREGVSPHRPMHHGASSAMTWGVTTLIFFWMPLIAIPTGILSIVFGGNAVKAIRNEPNRYQGDDRAKTGRLLGIIGLAVSSVLLLLFIVGFVFRSG